MIENIKPVESLTVADFRAHPVWEWLHDDEIGDTMMQPVEELPVESLDNRLIGAPVAPRERFAGMGIFRKFRRQKSTRHSTLSDSLDRTRGQAVSSCAVSRLQQCG